MRKLTCIAFACLVSSGVMAISPENMPMPKVSGNTFVSDAADVLDEANERKLDDILTQHYEKTGNQIAVVTTNDTKESASPKDFSTKLFNLWGLGDAEKDNGLLIMLSMNDRRIEFETGYGLEGVIPDVVLFRIQQEHMVPLFKKGDYQEGLLKGTYVTLDKINEASIKEAAYQQQQLAKKQAQQAQSEVKTLSSANTGDDGMGFFSKALLWLGLFISSSAGSLYLINLSRRRSRKGDINENGNYTKTLNKQQDKIKNYIAKIDKQQAEISKANAELDPKNGKMHCAYCNTRTYQTSAIGTSFKEQHLSPYQVKMLKSDAGDIDFFICNACSYVNTVLENKKELSSCLVCDEKSRYQFLVHTMRLNNYFNVYKDNVDRTISLKDVTLKGVVSDWQKSARATIDQTHCFNCGDFRVKKALITIDFTKIKPKPKPKSSYNSYDDDDDGFSSRHRSSSSSRSSSYSSSSYGSGSSYGGSSSSSSSSSSNSGFGGGDSGGGGAGSSW